MSKGKTAFQKIIDSHLMKTLPDGRLVLQLDRVWGHEITTPNAIIDAKGRGCDVVFNPNKVKTMIDHVNPAKDTASAIQGQMVREWSREHGIQFADVGRNGVCHALIPEMGWVLPGNIGIMGDSHTCTHGAFGAFSAGVGTSELEIGIITGLWVCPPQKVIRINFNGTLPANVFSKDLILTLINKIGVRGATNAVLKFGGPVIEKMSMDARMTITNMAVEAGATSGMMPIDDVTRKFIFDATGNIYNDHDLYNSDPDAEYDDIIEIDVSNMVPVITDNYSPGDVKPVTDLVGKKINQVYIGSCTNGRIEDLRIAAGIFQKMNAQVADGVRCVVVPATKNVFDQALEEGLITIFQKAGCYVSGPTCGACLGMSCGVIAPGEVCVSTTNRNFPGRMGKDGMVHLTSPATAAITAIDGSVSIASKELCGEICEYKTMLVTPRVTFWEDVPYEPVNYRELLANISGGSEKEFSGSVFCHLDKNVDTDQIIPAKYLTEINKSVFGEHCMEDADISSSERSKLLNSQILITGENFGCGSSREHAPWALEGAGIQCVIAPSFARIFENNMFANGLLCVTLNEDELNELVSYKPEHILVNWEEGQIQCNGLVFNFTISEYQKNLIRNGGLLGVMIKLAAELQQEGKLK